MQRLRKILIDWLKKLFSDSHSAIVSIAFGAVILGGGGVYVFAKKIWILLINIAQSPTPLWATIVLVPLLAGYILLKIPKHHSSKTSADDIFLMEDNDLKWKVTDFKNGAFAIEQDPFCLYHDSRYVSTSGGQYMCRELFSGGSCKSRIVNNGEISTLYDLAKVKAEKQVHKYKTKC